MLGVHHAAICTADVGRSLRFWRDGLGLTELFDQTFAGDWPALFAALSGADEAPQEYSVPRHGFFLLSLQREVDVTLSTLADLGFTDGVRQLTMSATAGKAVPTAVITAPDGVLVELTGPAA